MSLSNQYATLIRLVMYTLSSREWGWLSRSSSWAVHRWSQSNNWKLLKDVQILAIGLSGPWLFFFSSSLLFSCHALFKSVVVVVYCMIRGPNINHHAFGLIKALVTKPIFVDFSRESIKSKYNRNFPPCNIGTKWLQFSSTSLGDNNR